MTRARSILAHSLAESTRADYKSAISSIASFCTKHKLQLSFPVSADTICLWMASMASTLSYATIQVYMHGVGTTHVELGCPSPLDVPIVWRMFTAVKRLQGAKASKQKLPITNELLLQLERWQDVSSVYGLAQRAAMWLATCGLLRSGEFAIRNRSSNRMLRRHLTALDSNMQPLPSGWEKQTTDAVTCLRVHIAASKTDPFRQGVEVLVSNPHAIRAMVDYLRARGPAGPDEALFCGKKGGALEVKPFIASTQQLLRQAGLANAAEFAGHSFRRGGATSLHEVGVPDSLIRTMGRWRSFAFARYIDVPHERIIAAGLRMARMLRDGAALAQGKSAKAVTFAPAHKLVNYSVWD